MIIIGNSGKFDNVLIKKLLSRTTDPLINSVIDSLLNFLTFDNRSLRILRMENLHENPFINLTNNSFSII